MNLIFKDDDILNYLRDNNVIKKQTNMPNIAIDIDKYVIDSVNFRKTKTLEPLEGINLLRENKLIKETNYDSSHNPFSSPNIKRNTLNNSKLFSFEKNYSPLRNEEKLKTENFSNLLNSTNKIDKFKKKEYIPDIHPIAEEGKSEFLITGMKINDNNKKSFYDLDNEMSNLNELKESKFLPPLTKRSNYFKEKNITIRSQKDQMERENKEIEKKKGICITL